MVTQGYSWDNPAPREGEEEGLRLLLNEIDTDKLPYDGTTLLDLAKAKLELSKKRDANDEDLKKNLELMADYCVGQLRDAGHNKNKQILHYRRLEMVMDHLDKINDPAVNIRDILRCYINRRNQ